MNNIYCPVPWTEVHINADGTYHACGAQPNLVSNTVFGSEHNVHIMSIKEWMSSQYQEKNRQNKLDNVADNLCIMCYAEESVGKSSKRDRELHKYPVIPIKFQKPTVDLLPVSYHISLGNECNLSCKMCTPVFSSKIATELKQEGKWAGPIKVNWTEDKSAWNMVVNTICNTEKLEAVHIVGGEPLINDRFERLVDALIQTGNTNIYIGFTTNGTFFNQSLVEKLNVFRHVDIGISVEASGILNNYIRSGSEINKVLNNIKLYLTYRKENHVYITVRVVPSALSVHTIDDLFKWCIENKLDVMSNMLTRPDFMAINQLPRSVKEKTLEKFSSWQYSTVDTTGTNPRDPNYYREHIDHELKAIINMLKKPNDPVLTKQLYTFLEQKKWFDNPEIAKYFEADTI